MQLEVPSSSFGAYGRLSLLLSETVYRATVGVLTAVLSKFEVFGFLRKCRLSLTMEVIRSSEMSVIFHLLSSRNITEDMDLHHQHQNLKSVNNNCRHFHLLVYYFARILDSVPVLRLYTLQHPTPRTKRCPCSVALVGHEASCSRQALSCLSCK